mmetsp:Transcript_57237/g.170677  ORF Transcript_57237/g.170677 Transcript_57237/m.170677 type:complete len:104 (+) Transcript_57237:289-600(+)
MRCSHQSFFSFVRSYSKRPNYCIDQEENKNKAQEENCHPDVNSRRIRLPAAMIQTTRYNDRVRHLLDEAAVQFVVHGKDVIECLGSGIALVPFALTSSVSVIT